MNIPMALNWMLFLGLFPLSFVWLRRAWRIMARRDYSEVALKHGESPDNPAAFASIAASSNLLAGGILVAVIALVVGGLVDYGTWTAIAGTTIWLKLVGDFIVSRHAHPIRKRQNPGG